MFSAQEIRAGLHTHTIGQKLEVYPIIDSTNRRAIELARDGAPDGTLVVADEQTSGRGRLGRSWSAPPGSSLLISLLLRPALQVRQAPRAIMLCSLAAVEAIAQVCGMDAAVKWPNDLVYAGKKLGGVLTELGVKGEALEYIVVGMGLNVNLDSTVLTGLVSPATSLATELGRPVGRLPLLIAILEAFERRYDRLRTGWSPHEEWRQYLVTIGQQVTVRSHRDVVEGLVEDVDADGALLLRTREGRLRTILAGDVTLRGSSEV